MIIQRILTNNAVIIVDKNNKEKIVCGKGIGFKKKIGDEIEKSLINKTFILVGNELNDRFEQLLIDIPIEYVQLAYDVVEMARLQFAKRFNDSMIITLSDHFYGAIERYKEGLKITNGLIWDIQMYYDLEYEIGENALNLIEERMGYRLPDDEAAFIALHIVNAEMDNTNMSNIYEATKVIQKITTIVKYYFSADFDTTSVYYYRFITHLKYFSQRLFNKKQYSDVDDLGMLSNVKNKYSESYKCVLRIKDFLKQKYDYLLSDEEILYLTIHIQRVIYKGSK